MEAALTPKLMLYIVETTHKNLTRVDKTCILFVALGLRSGGWKGIGIPEWNDASKITRTKSDYLKRIASMASIRPQNNLSTFPSPKLER